ncbi:rhomboid family intramembrane serine protease [Bacillus sp. REN3]|uniref:rhomboid family protein n=1 Tax=Bacillus sp. REN3 TaxID=2802440 RepID=UPI001AEE829C|nr:rhomboid family intramembrane serine protease [Bacillus sp. REN3]
MAFLEEYLYWRVAEFLISNQGYRILQLSNDQNELWLEKTENKQAQVVRLLHYNLDWSNWLQRDIETTAGNGERIRRGLAKGELKLLNVYFSAYPPVDDYEFRLEEPYRYSDSSKVTIESILIDRANAAAQLAKFEQTMGVPLGIDIADGFTDDDTEAHKKNALFQAANRAKAERSVFNYGKPFFTYLFIAAQIIVFLLLEAAGGSTDTATLIKFGAKFNPLILEGEWWRFFTPIFIHIGFLHLFMNTLALYYLGTLVERLYGNMRFLFIYMTAGLGGTLASFLFSPNLSAGASGAIFGCFGALLYFGVVHPRLFWRTLGLNIFVVLGINLAFGFTVPGIDNAGHLGGLAGGFAAAGIVHLPGKKRPVLQFLFLAVAIATMAFSLRYGFSDKADLVDERSILLLAQQHIQEEEYGKAYDLLSEYSRKDVSSAEILFLLSYTEIKQDQLEDAKQNLFKVIELDPAFHEAYFNLALIYMEENNFPEAQKFAEKAVELNAGEESYQKTLNQINHFLSE